MTKYFSLLTCLLFISFSVQAQDEQREAFVDVLAQATCECLDGKDPSEMEPSSIEMTVGLCIINAYTEHTDDYPDVNIDIGNTNEMERLGEEIGFRMFNYCPSLLMQLAMASEGLDESDMEDWDIEAPSSEIQSTGTLVRVEGETLASVVIKNSEGEKEHYLWIEPFPGDELLGQESETWKGKAVSIYAELIEIYDPATQTYEMKRVITEMVVLD